MCLFGCRFPASSPTNQVVGHSTPVDAGNKQQHISGAAQHILPKLETVCKWTGAAAGFGVMVLCVWLEVDRIAQLYLNEHPDTSFAWNRLGGGPVVYPLLAMGTSVGYLLGQVLGRQASEPSTSL